jgi:transposase
MIHVGIDLHKHFCEIGALDDQGKVVSECRLYNDDQAAIVRYFQSLPGPVTVAVEATRNWYWLYELLETEVARIKLADSRQLLWIAKARLKNDKIDARKLANLERTDLLPEAYIPPRVIRDGRELLRYRISRVHDRTSVKNRIHGLIDKLGITHGYTDLFGKAGMTFLKALSLRPVYRTELDGYLRTLAHLTEEIELVTKEIKQTIRQDPRGDRLATIPGIGELTANLLLNEIGDIKRFATADRLCGYGAIVPRMRQSAEHSWYGHITKEGNRYIRWALIEAAQKAPSKDAGLQKFYLRIAYRRGPQKARVAVARKLLIAVWHVLTYDEPYELRITQSQSLSKPGGDAGPEETEG